MTLETVPISETLSFSEDDIYDKWILISTPIPVLTVIGCYFLFVLKIGPKFMEKREPYDLTKIMMVYNIYQVLYNGALVTWLFIHPHGFSYLRNHSCHPLDPKNNPLRYELALAAWAYLFSKLVDLLDTTFMVLRKKFSHMTFLHLYHHTAMVLCSWYCIKYIRAEQGVIPGTINAFVHVVMYTYYFLAAFGPGMQKYLWWKRYITRLQMAQFVVVISFWAYLFINDCEVSQAYNVMWITNVFVILVLFTNFYIQTYIIKPSKAKKEVKKEE